MKIYTWKVLEETRLDAFLRAELPKKIDSEISNSKIRRLIVAGSVHVNGKQCRIPSFMLYSGSLVVCSVDEEKLFFEKQPDDIDFILTEKDVLFEDESLIVVNKPAFLPTEETIVQGRKNMHQCVVDYLWKKNPSLRNPPYAGIMHRLDRETSGVLLFTKSRSVNAAVHDMFENHTAQKSYRAVCNRESAFAKSLKNGDTFTVEGNMDRISAKSSACKMGLVKQGGLYSKTQFTVEAVSKDFCFIDCALFTGRTHQIRVHLSSKGLPICGDELYGGDSGISALGGRIMLHAKSLEFPHPVTGERVCIMAPLPEGFSL